MKNDQVDRRTDGFVWLSRHSRRADIVSFVRGTRDTPPDWLRADRVWPKVQRDRAIWKAAHPPGGAAAPSLREIAAQFKDSKEPELNGITRGTVANVLNAYRQGGPTAKTDKPRLKLRAHARRAITRDVLAQFDRGEITATDVAGLIGNGADHRNAVYWLAKMRQVFEKQDEGTETNRQPKRKR